MHKHVFVRFLTSKSLISREKIEVLTLGILKKIKKLPEEKVYVYLIKDRS